VFVAIVVVVSIGDLFNANEIEVGVKKLMDQNVGVHNVLATIQKIVGLFKTLINFSLLQFDDLTTLMIPTIIGYVKFTNEVHIVIRHPFKLTLEQKLLNFI
jgi:hypothetical protein